MSFFNAKCAPQKNIWNAAKYSQNTTASIHEEPIGEYVENGVTVKRYAPGYAHGVRPQKNIKQG